MTQLRLDDRPGLARRGLIGKVQVVNPVPRMRGISHSGQRAQELIVTVKPSCREILFNLASKRLIPGSLGILNC